MPGHWSDNWVFDRTDIPGWIPGPSSREAVDPRAYRNLRELIADEKQITMEHCKRRSAEVYRVLAAIDVMTVTGLLGGRDELLAGAAQVQSGSGRNTWIINSRMFRNAEVGRDRVNSKHGYRVAAHVLPCQIFVRQHRRGGDPVELWDFLPPGSHAEALRQSFARTDDVPKKINECDTITEDCGLCWAFYWACRAQHEASQVDSSSRAVLSRERVDAIHAQFCAAALRATGYAVQMAQFQTAHAAQKADRSRSPFRYMDYNEDIELNEIRERVLRFSYQAVTSGREKFLESEDEQYLQRLAQNGFA
ncbi:MAG: hypothetical protein AAF517_17650 [Planctomycetota bacterium]